MNRQRQRHSERPKVSILVPNLNNRRFLAQRMRTILDQTLSDWELIIVDSYSDDGVWELFQEFAAHDARIQISQAPRDGIYPNLNRCIAQARGEYVYIATSDDTMSPDCLETMATAMDRHPECGMCHTCLKVIDEQGQDISNFWEDLPVGRFYGDLMTKQHIRFAPYDGILHCALYTVYTSLTQLLIRRSVFETVGLFPTRWGSEGDFEWGMRVGLVCNILHLPETLATWRIHVKQASRQYNPDASARKARFCQMIQAAIAVLKKSPSPSTLKINVNRLTFLYRQEQFLSGIWECPTKRQRYGFFLKFFFIRPDIIAHFLLRRLQRKPYIAEERFSYLHQELERLGLTNLVKIAS